MEKKESLGGRSLDLSYLRTPGKLLRDMGELVGLLIIEMSDADTSVPIMEKSLRREYQAVEQFNFV